MTSVQQVQAMRSQMQSQLQQQQQSQQIDKLTSLLQAQVNPFHFSPLPPPSVDRIQNQLKPRLKRKRGAEGGPQEVSFQDCTESTVFHTMLQSSLMSCAMDGNKQMGKKKLKIAQNSR